MISPSPDKKVFGGILKKSLDKYQLHPKSYKTKKTSRIHKYRQCYIYIQKKNKISNEMLWYVFKKEKTCGDKRG